MRNLGKDLEKFQHLIEASTDTGIAVFAINILPEAIQRAIDAEKKIKELEDKIKALEEENESVYHAFMDCAKNGGYSV